MAIPEPIKNREIRATGKFGKKENKMAPKKDTKNAARITCFSPKFSTATPDGMENTP
jgi:hypothetical protein